MMGLDVPRFTIFLRGRFFTQPNQENKFCIMSLMQFLFGIPQGCILVCLVFPRYRRVIMVKAASSPPIPIHNIVKN